MAQFTRTNISAAATQAQMITQINTNTSAIATAVNTIEGGNSKNIASSTVTRREMADDADVDVRFGDILSTLAHVVKGGTVAKVSGLVFSIADLRAYPTYRGVTPFSNRGIIKTSIANDSVVANRRTFIDIGYDGVIDKNDVALGGTAPTLQDGHIRLARVSASASIMTGGITMLADSVFTSASAYPKDFMYGLRTEMSLSDPINDIRISPGLRCRSGDDTTNISVTAAITVAADAAGANGLDTGTIANNSPYHLWIVADSSGSNSPAGLLSLSATSPTMPSGYDKKRRLCMFRRGTGNWQRKTTIGDTSYLDTATNLATGFGTTAWTAVNAATQIGVSGFPGVFAGPILWLRHQEANVADMIAVTNGNATSATASSNVGASYEFNQKVSYNIGFVVAQSASAGRILLKRVTGTGTWSANALGWREHI